MPKAIHLICKRITTGSLDGLSLVTKPDLFRSISWGLTEDEVAALVDGWLYLHETKATPSQIGGRIERIEPSGLLTKLGKPEFAIVFRSTRPSRQQKWRGAAHGMAWTGGLVEADLPHEVTV